MNPRRFAASIVLLMGFSTFAAAQEGVVVEVRMVSESLLDSYFDPIGLHIEPGTTVHFVNDSGLHSSRAYIAYPGKLETARVPDGGAWATPLATDAEIVFTIQGVYDYYDPSFEAAGMVGRIIVGDPSAYPAQDPSELPAVIQENLPTVEQILAEPDGALTWEEFEAQKE